MERFSGPSLQAARRRAGKSREQLAVEVGRSYQTIINYERNYNSPTAAVLPALAHAVGVEIGDLFAEEAAS